MSSVKNSTSAFNLHDVLPRQEKRLPHTLPGHAAKPPVPPRRQHLLERKIQSCQQLPLGSEPGYSSTRPRLQPISRDRPIPLPRKKPLQVTRSSPASNTEYTPLQPHWFFKPSTTPQTLQRSAPITLRDLAQTPEHLPATIETIEGVYGFGQQFTISAGDKLHVHFAKSVQMAVLCDRTGTQFHVPLSSAMKFGLCQQDEEFEKVSDIVKKSQHLPHVICCQQHIPRRGKQEEVKKDELLIVKKYEYGALTCQSLWSDREIMLHKNCKGSFSSSPEKTSTYLLDLRQHLPHFIPCKVYLYPPVPRKKHDLFTIGKVFTLKECTTVTSLVVSNIGDEELFDIILDETLSTLRVTVLGKAPAMSLPRKLSIMPGQYTKLIKRDVLSGFQEALYTTLRRGFESEGVQLAAGGSGCSDVSGGRGDYEYVDVVPAQQYYSAGEFSRVPQSTAEQNRDYLKSLSMHEISLLLKAMNLEKYQATFSKEQVSGSLLAEFNDHNLQRYLHIHNPSHRQKLLQVISGETVAEELLF